MIRRLLLLVFVVMMVGCSSSSNRENNAVTTTSAAATTQPDPSSVSAALCRLPSAAELAGILGAPVTRRLPSSEVDRGGSDTSIFTSIPRCILIAGRTQLAIVVFTFSDAATMQPILTMVRQGKSGSCRQTSARRASRVTMFECTSTAAKAPDFSGAPEVTARAFVGRSGVTAGWTGPPGAPLPKDSKSKLALLRLLASTAVARFA